LLPKPKAQTYKYKNVCHQSETLIKFVKTLPPGFHGSLFTFTTRMRLHEPGSIADCFAQFGPSKLRICFSKQESHSETMISTAKIYEQHRKSSALSGFKTFAQSEQ